MKVVTVRKDVPTPQRDPGAFSEGWTGPADEYLTDREAARLLKLSQKTMRNKDLSRRLLEGSPLR
jgi:hypothetical protein